METPAVDAPQYVYAIRGACMSKVKIGRWRGSISALFSRYTTYYGWGFDATVFQVDDSVFVENLLKKVLRPHWWRNELFSPQAMPSFMEVGSEFCHDSVFSTDLLLKNAAYDAKRKVECVATAIYSGMRDFESARKRKREDEAQAEADRVERNRERRAEKKRQKALQKQKRDKEKAKNITEALEGFIRGKCTLGDGLRVDTTAFKKTFESATKIQMSASTLKSLMEQRSLPLQRRRLCSDMHPKQVFEGIAFL